MKHPTLTSDQYRRVCLVALILLCAIVVTGGVVRLSGSGLGCTDWPTCENNRVVAPAQYNAMIEFGNRLFSGVVSLSVLAAVVGAYWRGPKRRDLILLSWSLVIGVAMQIVLGGITVWYKLNPLFVMSHYLLSAIILIGATTLHWRASQPDGVAKPVVHSDYINLGRALLMAAAAVLVAGTVVTGAGPHAGSPDVHRLDLAVASAAKIHGSLAMLLALFSLIMLVQLRSAGASSTLVRKAMIVFGLVVAQAVLGVVQYATELPRALVVAHIAGSVLVWVSALRLNLAFFERWGNLGVEAFDGTENTYVENNNVKNIDAN